MQQTSKHLSRIMSLGEQICRPNIVLMILLIWLTLFYVLYNREMSFETYQASLDERKGSLQFLPNKLQRFKDATVDAQLQRLKENVTTVIDDSNNFNLTSIKKILYFTSYFNMPDFQLGFGHEPFLKCDVSNCFATNNKSLLSSISEFDAIMFHIRDMNNGQIPIPNQKKRKSYQRYVMFLMESPLNDGFPYQNFASFFNWTMTYRWDSDFPRPYSWIQPINQSLSLTPTSSNPYNLSYPEMRDDDLQQLTASIQSIKEVNNGASIAWMVSNCGTHSERENLVEELQRFVKVDIYGQCGPLKCSHAEESTCMKMIEKKYKFYLSFENSFCDDYVTEKFFKVLNYNIIPIVLGSGNYSKMAPKKSYINVKDFESVIKLSEYIKYLESNATAYAEYFVWKKHFQVVDDKASPFCELCKALNDPAYPTKSYTDIHDWWRSQAHCIKKGKFPWSKTGLENAVDFFEKGANQIISILKDSGLG